MWTFWNQGGVLRVVLVIVITAIYLLFGHSALAKAGEVILEDTFNDTTLVDMTRTTATIDTENGVVRLPKRSLTSAIDILDHSIGYAVATSEGIKMFEYDDATEKLVQNNAFSVPTAVNATGVSIRQDNLNIWAITEDSITYFRHATGDPALELAGLSDVLAVAAFENKDKALMLQRTAGKAKITKLDASTETLQQINVFETNITDPIGISLINDSPDFVLTSATGVHFFIFDDFTRSYVEDTARRLALTNIRSISSDDIGNVIATETRVDYWMNDDALDPPQVVAIYSVGPVTEPVAVALRRNHFEYAVLDGDGNVRYYIFDEAGKKMVEDANLGISGLGLNAGYSPTEKYFSVVRESTRKYDAVFLTVDADVPMGTSIQYYVSSDGGISWKESTPGTWTAVTPGKQFAVKAILSTTNSNITPKIYDIKLTADDDFQIIIDDLLPPRDPRSKGVLPNIAERGRNYAFEVKIKKLTGNEIANVDSVSIQVPKGSAERNMIFEGGVWKYEFLVPELTQRGQWPDDGIYLVEIRAVRGTAEKTLNVELEVNGHIFRRVVIQTVNW